MQVRYLERQHLQTGHSATELLLLSSPGLVLCVEGIPEDHRPLSQEPSDWPGVAVSVAGLSSSFLSDRVLVGAAGFFTMRCFPVSPVKTRWANGCAVKATKRRHHLLRKDVHLYIARYAFESRQQYRLRSHSDIHILYVIQA